MAFGRRTRNRWLSRHEALTAAESWNVRPNGAASTRGPLASRRQYLSRPILLALDLRLLLTVARTANSRCGLATPSLPLKGHGWSRTLCAIAVTFNQIVMQAGKAYRFYQALTRLSSPSATA